MEKKKISSAKLLFVLWWNDEMFNSEIAMRKVKEMTAYMIGDKQEGMFLIHLP